MNRIIQWVKRMLTGTAEISRTPNKVCLTLTKRQAEVLAFIVYHNDKYRRSPTYREIGKYCGFNVNAALQHVRNLQRKGYVTIDARVSRGVRLTDEAIKDGPELMRRHIQERAT